MRENRSYGSEGGEPQPNAASLPLSIIMTAERRATICWEKSLSWHLWNASPNSRMLIDAR
jgi:hypothetical protein